MPVMSRLEQAWCRSLPGVLHRLGLTAMRVVDKGLGGLVARFGAFKPAGAAQQG